LPSDASTGVLLQADEQGKVTSYINSAAILRQLAFLGFPYSALGSLGLMVPVCIRDGCYQMFARNRGAIWRRVKQMTGLGDTHMGEYRHCILGLEEEEQVLDPGWGFGQGTEGDRGA
jgi:predicted DCC family thiol-disulfide oxidoreductase YuxK